MEQLVGPLALYDRTKSGFNKPVEFGERIDVVHPKI
jgi:hypothetical protein